MIGAYAAADAAAALRAPRLVSRLTHGANDDTVDASSFANGVFDRFGSGAGTRTCDLLMRYAAAVFVDQLNSVPSTPPWSSRECRVRWPGAAPRCVRASYGETKGKGDHEYAIRNRIVASDAVVHRQPGGQHLGHVAADRPHSDGLDLRAQRPGRAAGCRDGSAMWPRRWSSSAGSR